MDKNQAYSALRAHADIVKLAKHRARRIWDANVARFAAAGYGDFVADPDDAPEGFALTVEAQLDLLLDPAEPDTDVLARVLAARVGLAVGCTAPEFRRFRLGLPDGSESWAWALLGSPGEQFFFTDGNVPGISAITDPVAALCAALTPTETHA